jgi:amidohydrolase
VARRLHALSAALLLGLAVPAAAAPPSPPSSVELAQRVEALLPQLVALRRDLHAHPELSNREARTGALIAARLRKLGLEVREHVAGHGVIATLHGARPGKTVAVRADLDALPIAEPPGKPYASQNPGVKHACGHDAHTAVAVGVAELLWPLRDRLAGEVRFLFQPAEESAPPGERGGSLVMIEQGALDPPPAAILGLHVLPTFEAGEVAVRPGPTMAVADRFVATIRGKKTHGAYPHDGIDAVAVAAEAITALQTIRSRRIDTLEPMVLTIGSVHGGNRFNIVADEVVLEGTLRTLDEGVRKRVLGLMREILAGVTAAHGARFELVTEELAPLTSNDLALTERVRASLARALGAAHVHPVERQMGAEDFGYYQRKVPGTFFFLGVGNKQQGISAMIHTPEFDLDERAIGVGVRAMSEAVLGELGLR